MDPLLPPLTETVLHWQAGPIKLGTHATLEVGVDAAATGMRHALLVTDPGVAATGLPARVAGLLEQEGIRVTLFDRVHVEPTDVSVEEAARELAGIDFDGVVAVGGGSAIDTAKLVSLLVAFPGAIGRFLARPHGDGALVPGPLPPLIAVPTTAGTGSEVSQIAMVEVRSLEAKAAVSHPALRPRLAVIDPLNTLTMPPAVTAASGYDVLVQSLESYTAIPMIRRGRAEAPFRRTGYPGANVLSDLFAEKTIELVGRYFLRSVADPGDLEARVGMVEAAAFSRMAGAGAHIPHALGYPIASHVREYRPAGYGAGEPLIPHGTSVVVAAPAAFRFLYDAAPRRHLHAARLLGAVTAGTDPGDGRDVLPERLVEILQATGGPLGIGALGYTEDDIPAIVKGGLEQQRLLVMSPRPVGARELERIVREAFAYS